MEHNITASISDFIYKYLLHSLGMHFFYINYSIKCHDCFFFLSMPNCSAYIMLYLLMEIELCTLGNKSIILIRVDQPAAGSVCADRAMTDL